MQAAFSPSMWTFGVTIDCWIETPGVAGTGGGGDENRRVKMRRYSKRGGNRWERDEVGEEVDE